MLPSLRPTLSLPAPFRRLHRLLRVFRLNFDNSYDATHQTWQLLSTACWCCNKITALIHVYRHFNEVLVLFFFTEG